MVSFNQHSKHMKRKLSGVNIKLRQHRDSRLFQNSPAKKREQSHVTYAVLISCLQQADYFDFQQGHYTRDQGRINKTC